MDSCIFCKIVKGEIPCAKIWEDDNFIAFLDIKPATKGMTLLIPKIHSSSDIFDTSDEEIKAIFSAGKTISSILKKAFDVERVAVVFEGVGVPHLHMKLYPLHGYKSQANKEFSLNPQYFEKYEGYISTQTGPQMSAQELEETAKYIRKKGI